MHHLVTIGVYGFTAQTFLDRLREADVAQLLDVRQRRGVRGSDYAWANSARLQAALAEADIEYRHEASGRRLSLDVTRVERVGGFDASIWAR